MVLSAHLQDTKVRGQDMNWLPRERRFVLVGERLDRMCGLSEVRRLTGFHLDRVLAVRHQRFAPGRSGPLSLQAILFHPGEAPGGAVVLSFAEGPAIRIEVECIEAALSDLGEARADGAPADRAVADAGS